MGFVYPDCDFGLDFKPHPELEKLKQDVKDWLIDTQLVDPTDIPLYVAKSTYASYCFSDHPYSERFVLVCRWFALMWIIDNLRDEVASREAIRGMHEDYLRLCRDGRTNSENKLLQEFAAIHDRMKELSDPDWYHLWSYSNYQGVLWSHEMVFKKKLTEPDMATGIVGRTFESHLFCCIIFHEFLSENYVPLRVRANPGYFMLLSHANEVCIFYNDYIGWERELKEDNIYAVFRAIQAKRKQTNDQFQEASNELREIVMDAFDKFNVVANRIDELFKEEDLKLMQTLVKHMRRYIQGNKDFHFICPGYISKDAIIKFD